MRSTLGLLVGIITAAILIYVGIMLAQVGLPDSIAAIAARTPDPRYPLASVPTQSKILVEAGFALGAFLGALLADLISQRGVIGYWVAGLVVLMVLCIGVFVLHPVWMAVAGVVLPLAGAYFARKITRVPLL